MTAPTGPTFLIAGAARAGSTAVAEALRTHPDAFVTQPKEPHYFAFAGQKVAFTGPGDDATINRVARTDRDDYLSLFPREHRYLALGEGSVSTLYYHDRSIPAIQAINPEMRIIILLRDPVERAYSSYQYLRVRGFEPLDDFLTAVEEEPRRRQAGWHHLWHYTAMSRYAESVGRFRQAFGPDQVGVWFYDSLTESPQRCLAEIHAFLGLDVERAASSQPPKVNVSGKPRQAVLQSAIRWASRHEVARNTLKRTVPFGLRERVRSLNLRPNQAPAADRAQLADRFAADLETLADLLGQPLPAWTSLG